MDAKIRKALFAEARNLPNGCIIRTTINTGSNPFAVIEKTVCEKTQKVSINGNTGGEALGASALSHHRALLSKQNNPPQEFIIAHNETESTGFKAQFLCRGDEFEKYVPNYL